MVSKVKVRYVVQKKNPEVSDNMKIKFIKKLKQYMLLYFYALVLWNKESIWKRSETEWRSTYEVLFLSIS